MTGKEALEKAWDLVHNKYPENNDEIQLVRYAIKTAMELNERDTAINVDFRLVTNYSTRGASGFTYIDNGHEIKCDVAIAIDIRGISDEKYDINSDSATNNTELKILYQDDKGIFYMGPIRRVYLDEKEVALMEAFLESAKKYHGDVIVGKE